jgi:heme/copper-type cytochrome/quinol oxidase subunit 1
MPRLSCWFIRVALLYLGIGVLVGGLILSAKGYPAVLSWFWLLLPAHIEMLIVGWLIQLTLGMAYWILPRLDGRGDRGRPALAWASFGILNVAVAGTTTLLVIRAFVPSGRVDLLLVPMALLHPMALAAFVGHAWPRVRPSMAVANVQPHPSRSSEALPRSR